MSISSYGSNVDRITRNSEHPGRTLFTPGRQMSVGQTYYQGDLMCYDSTINSSAGGFRAVAATGDGATFVGISDQQVTSGVLQGPYTGLTQVNAAVVGPDWSGPLYGVEADMVLNTGDAFNMGSKVYLVNGGTTQQVSVTNPGDGNYVGIFVDPLGAVASAAAGQLGRILIGCRYPKTSGADLTF